MLPRSYGTELKAGCGIFSTLSSQVGVNQSIWVAPCIVPTPDVAGTFEIDLLAISRHVSCFRCFCYIWLCNTTCQIEYETPIQHQKHICWLSDFETKNIWQPSLSKPINKPNQYNSNTSQSASRSQSGVEGSWKCDGESGNRSGGGRIDARTVFAE